MRKLTIMLGLLFILNALAAENLSEPSWKQSMRSLITRLAGIEWSDRLLGPAPTVVMTPEIVMPEIPVEVKKSTDVASYLKQSKEMTEYDRLSGDRRRQFDYNFIEELFMVTRKTEAKDEDLSNWLNTLDQGGSREGIYQALVLDEVYNSLESMDEKPSPRLIEYSLNFSQKFLHQTVKPEALAQLNLYSLKRILTEKGLDLIEYYETKDLDALYRWYAILSGDMGQNFSPLLNSKVREDASPSYHYAWAKEMPIQHIKSEFIIKMHSVMNGLQLIQE